MLPGLELCRLLYHDAVRPLLGDVPHAAARVDSGSELLGFDTARSTDHDWGPRLQLFVDDPAAAAAVRARLEDLPATVAGYPTRFTGVQTAGLGLLDPAGDRHGVTVQSLAGFLTDRLGVDPRDGWRDEDWLATPTQRLAELTGGAVYADTTGELTAVRRLLAWYPEPLWRGVLAAQWRRIAQLEGLVGRCAEVGDELGSAILAARVARDLMRLCLLLDRRWPPYAKWLGSAFAQLPGIGPVRAALLGAVRADAWVDREHHLVLAYQAEAARSNASGLHEPLDPRVRPFHDRPYVVPGADRFVTALGGARAAVDQIVDSVDARADVALIRRLFLNGR